MDTFLMCDENFLNIFFKMCGDGNYRVFWKWQRINVNVEKQQRYLLEKVSKLSTLVKLNSQTH